jgi:hypothetical protein
MERSGVALMIDPHESRADWGAVKVGLEYREQCDSSIRLGCQRMGTWRMGRAIKGT